MIKSKLFFLFIITGIFISAFVFLNLTAHVINIGDTYYVIPADSMAFGILLFYVITGIFYFALRNYVNFRLGVLNLILITIPSIYLSTFNGIGTSISRYNDTLLSSEYFMYSTIIFFLIGNILFFTNIIIGFFKFTKDK